jgi:putative transposase
MVCAKPGERTRLIYRMLVHHPGRRGEKNGFKERDFAELLEAARERWLTVFRLPAYAPDLNPAEGVWANLKNDLGNLAACTVDALADLTRTRLKKMQYRPDLLDGFIAETGLILARP